MTPRHGTEFSYVHGCRCPACRAAGELDELLFSPHEIAATRQMREAMDRLFGGNEGWSVRVPGLRVIEGGRE